MASVQSAPLRGVNSIRHLGQTRKNIPTEELRGFVDLDETAPTVLLYPRDASLDPQLVWNGKDEQDRADLAVPVVPIYAQEQIHPEALIQGLAASARAASKGGYIAEEEAAYQIDLFNDFDTFGDDFERKVEFYRHDQQWSNRMILGDSLLAMASLAEKEAMKGKVQTIYIDPPYGIGFSSNWQVSTRNRDVRDGRAEDVTRQPEQVRAFRDIWELGIPTYLGYLRDRLTLSRELLSETGSVFVQIGSDNVHLVRCVLDEVFGIDSFVSIISFQTTSGFETNTIANVGDFLLWYCKDRERVKIRPFFVDQPPTLGKGNARWVLLEDGSYRGVSAKERDGHATLPVGARLYKPGDLQSPGAAGEPQPFEFEGKTYLPGLNSHWKPNYPNGMRRLAYANRIHVAKNSLQYRRFASDFPFTSRGNIWTDTITGSFTDEKVYVVQTNTKVIERCILMTSDPGDLVLDPTCGSGTTAFVAEQWGRRWIVIDTSRVALALARTRLMAAKYPYYLLADSPEGIRKECDLSDAVPPLHLTLSDIRKGFVYKRVPHVTLESIANNPDIREGMTQHEIDAAIVRHAKNETLYDQPFEDPKRVRVSGPFTMESLSPHRVLAAADEDLDGIVTPGEQTESRDFTTMILDNLRAAGAQNTVRSERLRFDRLEAFPGTWIQGAGEYTDVEGTTRRVAVSIGPEHGTVGTHQVKQAAKEAVQGVGFDLLLVCGFAFDAAVSEEAKRFGKLTVLPTRMNPDLAMGDDLLKKTGAGNLFMVFGEPDIAIEPAADDQLTVTIRGVDVYDPTTGEVRSNSTDDIACWFIDTDYDEEAFFVRHAYFTGAGEPYKKLQKALRAEIDEGAWAALYSTTSRPFARPNDGKIAVKAINHYGDEVLKVFSV